MKRNSMVDGHASGFDPSRLRDGIARGLAMREAVRRFGYARAAFGKWFAVITLYAFATAIHAEPPGWYEFDADLPVIASLSAQDGEEGAAGWRMGSDMELVHDDLLDGPVWEHRGGRHGWIRSDIPLPDAYQVVARLRVMQRGHGATLAVGADGTDANPGRKFELMLRPTGDRAWRVNTQRARREHYLEATELPAEGPARTKTETLNSIPGQTDFGERYARAPSPLSDEAYRREVESALNARPLATNLWAELRIEYRSQAVRMWINGIPVGEHHPAGHVDGDVHLQLDRSVRVAALEIHPLDKTSDAYEPVDLTERLNARAASGDGPVVLRTDSLPEVGSLVRVNGMPFRFARDIHGNDHVDIGQSMFRQRNRTGHFMAGGDRPENITWPSPRVFDPARIMFTTPNRAYSRLWLIAAFDGEPNTTPVVTARFFKPTSGFPIDSATEIPAFSARSAPGAAQRLPVTLPNGAAGSLWLVPIDLDAARIGSEMRDVSVLSLELTKEVQPYRGYPDPANYNWFQGGLPSGVRVFAMTLEKAPIHMIASGNRHGNVYVAPEEPLWQIDLRNQRSHTVSGKIRLHVTDPYDDPAGVMEQEFTLAADGAARIEIPIPTRVNGLHTVLTEVEVEPVDPQPSGSIRRLFRRETQQRTRLARTGTFVQLPPDRRQATKQNSPWGIFSWSGGHGTHSVAEDDMYLLRAAGARIGPTERHLDVETEALWGLRPQGQHIGNDQRAAQPWAFEDPYDPEKYAENRDQIGKRIAERSARHPNVPCWAMFIETAITAHLTYGVPRRWIGEDPTWTEEEARRVRGHMIYGKAVCEGIRMHAPDAKISLGWSASTFPIPLLESGFPRELFDYIGADDPGFERTPEMPIREVTPNRVWLLRQAMKEHGYDDAPVIHLESYYPSSHPLALGWRRSADHYARLHLLSLANIPQTIFSGTFSLQDCGSYWGSQHYGEHGLIGRQPEANPKPAFVTYATMTRLLDPPEYQGYLPTGSHSAYCLHFTSTDRNVYPMWTIRGRREARIRLPADSMALRVDEQGNEFPLAIDAAGWAKVSLTPTPVWIVSPQPIETVELGKTDHSFVRVEHPMLAASFGETAVRYRPENQVTPSKHHLLLDAMENPWVYVPGPYPGLAEGHWGAPRHDGPMRSEIVASSERNAPVWQITLDDPDVERPLTAWYGVFEPETPIAIPGKARALGVWADGRSNWGRIVYEVEDAEGEIWRSIGTKDDWNCDDIHTWSYFNYDGWRYIEFPLPSHLPYDDYREHDTTWWGSEGGDGVVQLPLKLRRIMIEMRTHNIYADDLVEMSDRSVRLHRLKAIYDDAESMTDTPVERQHATAGALQTKWAETARALPNPITALRETGVGDPTAFETLAPPDDYDGLVTRLTVNLKPVAGAKEYRVYVAAYEDGAGAERIAHGAEPSLTVSRLQPGFPLYLFATYVDADNKESKPTGARRILLADDFPFK